MFIYVYIGSRPGSYRESERYRARNGTSESEQDFSRGLATIHTSDSKRAKFRTARFFSFCNDKMKKSQ